MQDPFRASWVDIRQWVQALAGGRLATYTQAGYSLLCGDVQSGKTQEMMLFCWWQRYVENRPVVWMLRNYRADILQLRDRVAEFNARMDRLFGDQVHAAGDACPHLLLRPVPLWDATTGPEDDASAAADHQVPADGDSSDDDDGGGDAIPDVMMDDMLGLEDADEGDAMLMNLQGGAAQRPRDAWVQGPGVWVALYNRVQLARLHRYLDTFDGAWSLCIDEVDVTVRTRTRSDPTESRLLELQARAFSTLGVTATPLASLVTVPGPHRLLRLPPPPTYVGLHQIQWRDLPADDADMWQTCWRRPGGGRLLYVVDRLQAEQLRTQEDLAKRFPHAAVLVYNGEGIRVVTPTGAAAALVPAAGQGSSTYSMEAWQPDPTRLVHVFTGPRYPLAAVWQRLKDAAVTENVIVIAGVLAARGISYVSSDYAWRLTDQYLVPPPSMSGENLLQSLRLLGRAPAGAAPPTLWCRREVWADIHCHAEAIRRWVDACLAGPGTGAAAAAGWRDLVQSVRVPRPQTHLKAVRAALWEAMTWRRYGPPGRGLPGRAALPVGTPPTGGGEEAWLRVVGPTEVVPDLRGGGGGAAGGRLGRGRRRRVDEDDGEPDDGRFVISFRRQRAADDTPLPDHEMIGTWSAAPTTAAETKAAETKTATTCEWQMEMHRRCRRPPYRDLAWCAQHVQLRHRELQAFWETFCVRGHDDGWPWRPLQVLLQPLSSGSTTAPAEAGWVDEGLLYIHALDTPLDVLRVLIERQGPVRPRPPTWVTVETFLGNWEVQYWHVDRARLPVRVHIQSQADGSGRRGLVVYWR